MYLAPCSTLSTNPASSTNPSKIITFVLNFNKINFNFKFFKDGSTTCMRI